MKSFTVTGTCEHGKSVVTEIKLPLRAEVLEIEDEGDGETIVWLVANTKLEHYVTTVTAPSFCRVYSELIASALNVYLKTQEGQEAAIEYIRHDYVGTESPATADTNSVLN